MEESYWRRARATRRDFIRGIGIAAGALALAPAIAACRTSDKRGGAAGNAAGTGPASRPVRGGTLTSSTVTEAANLDYAVSTDASSSAIIKNCVEPLLTVDTQGLPTGLLATSWENPDGRTYIFRLRSGVTFQDGTAFNAGAVEYSLGRIRSNKASSQYAQLAYVDRIETPDEGTVKLTLSSPFAPLLYSLADHAGRVISTAIGEKYGADRLKIDLTGAGTGPFRFVEWTSGDHITLARNGSYWGKDAYGTQLPYADRLIYHLITDSNQALASLRSGEIDAYQLAVGVGGAPPQAIAGIKGDASLSYRDGPAGAPLILFFNQAREPLVSMAVRQAISLAIDRPAINHAVFFDTALPLDAIFSPAIWAYDDGYHPYLKRDVARAKQLLAQAGRPDGLAVELVTRTGAPAFQQTVELIKDQLKGIGVDVTLRLLESPAVLAALKAGQHQIGYQPINGGPDPDDWAYPYFCSNGALDAYTHYSNPDVDRLLEQARTTLDAAVRKTLYQQAQKLIVSDAAVCVVCDSTRCALSRASVHNVPLGPTPAVGASQVWKTG